MTMLVERLRAAFGSLDSTRQEARYSDEFRALYRSRMRVVLLIGAIFVPAMVVLDYIHFRWMNPRVPIELLGFTRIAAFVWYLLLRVVIGASRIDIRGLTVIEWLIFPTTAIYSTWLGIQVWGIDSSYFVGVVFVLMTRSFLIPGGLGRALPILLVCWLVYPLTTLLMASFDPAVAAQFEDAVRVSGFVLANAFILFLVFIASIGAHVIGHLQLQEYRLQRIGRYQIMRTLGAGGMGEVYLARHGLLKRVCAIKLLAPNNPVNETTRKRFEREAQHTSQLAHPNTIQIFDFGTADDGRLFYAMEFVEGADLRRIVLRYGTLPPARAIYLLLQACRSIQHAHDNGIIHRDIKPENCIVAGAGSQPDFLKVLDFGLAKTLREEGDPQLSVTGAVLGTPHYMAPELCLNRPVDARTDVYSLGCVLYFLVTGQTLFRAASWMEVMMLQTAEAPEAPTALNAEVPLDLERVILTCLRKDPDARFASAAELGDALLACRAAGSWSIKDATAWWDQYTDDDGQPLSRADSSIEAQEATTLDFSGIRRLPRSPSSE